MTSPARRAAGRLWAQRLLVVQTALAAGIAWQLATLVQPEPFFAPVAAVIVLGVAGGQQLRRAVELAVGVAGGILVADLLLLVIGGGALTVGVIVALAMAVALLLGAGPFLVNQAAVSGVLLATLGAPAATSEFDRFFSALIGGAVAILIGPVLFARNPLTAVGEQAERVLAHVAATLERVADALESGDAATAADALALARSGDAEIAAFEEQLARAREAIRLAPPRRRDLPRLEVYDDAAAQVDYAVRNTRVLARAANTAAVRDVPPEPDLADAVRLLARAVRALGEDLRHPEEESAARALARRAARDATAVLDRRADLSASLVVATIRSTAADILRGSGLDTEEMQAALGPYPGAD